MAGVKVSSNGETLYINGKYVVGCCESLEYTFERIANELEIDFEWED